MASTGTDAQPYFRVFNPYSQSTRFDPDGTYIRRWVPELRSVKDQAAIHDPTGVLGKPAVEKLGYCVPIVAHELGRNRAIAAFKNNAANKNALLNPAITAYEQGGAEDDGEVDAKKATKKTTKKARTKK